MSESRSAVEVLEAMRRHRRQPLLLRGFGPLVVAVAFAVAMMLMLPSVAPEQIVEKPVEGDAAGEVVP